MGHLLIFTLISQTDIFKYQQTESETENYQSVWHQTYCDITPLLSQTGIFKYQQTETENYLYVWCQTHHDVTDKNNNVSFEGLDVHYQ